MALFFFSRAHIHRLASTPGSSLDRITTTNIMSIANDMTTSLLIDTPSTSSFANKIQSPPLTMPPLYASLCVLLIIYTFSIVFGRLYTAMHSFTDCTMGIVLGTLIWWVQTSWEGFPILFGHSDRGYGHLVWLGVGKVHTPLPVPISSSLPLPDLNLRLYFHPSW